jgi:hypothetical protein
MGGNLGAVFGVSETKGRLFYVEVGEYPKVPIPSS